jgi:hypothetical protein
MVRTPSARTGFLAAMRRDSGRDAAQHEKMRPIFRHNHSEPFVIKRSLSPASVARALGAVIAKVG